MTCLEKWKKLHPDEDEEWAISNLCPEDIGINLFVDVECDGKCTDCWDMKIPEPDSTPTIKDSGERRQFYDADGNPMGVRDIQEGKGRCDQMPLDVVAYYLTRDGKSDQVLSLISLFQKHSDYQCLFLALDEFNEINWHNNKTMLLEVAKHFEEGAKKYGEHNWQKGIPVKCYIDSAVRHYLKWLRGDKDEPHDRAFCWNILCAIWTCKHKPELNDYKEEV